MAGSTMVPWGYQNNYHAWFRGEWISIKTPIDQIHPLIKNMSNTLAVRVITGVSFIRREFQSRQPLFSYLPEGKGLYQITSRPGRSGLAGGLKRKVDQFCCTVFWIFFILLSERIYRTIDCIRSAFSAFHSNIHETPVCQYLLACSMMSGVFNSRPRKPWYLFFWDVESALHVKLKWGSTTKL